MSVEEQIAALARSIEERLEKIERNQGKIYFKLLDVERLVTDPELVTLIIRYREERLKAHSKRIDDDLAAAYAAIEAERKAGKLI